MRAACRRRRRRRRRGRVYASPPRLLSTSRLLLQDDSVVLQFIHRALFEKILEADMERSMVCGTTAEEQDTFVDKALGLVDCSNRPVPPPDQRQADIAVIDQNIRLGDEVRVLGSDLAATLREKGFQGVCAILTGSSVHSDHFNSLLSGPGVDLVLEKGSELSPARPHWLAARVSAR
mgnify:CR=1 FL=1